MLTESGILFLTDSIFRPFMVNEAERKAAGFLNLDQNMLTKSGILFLTGPLALQASFETV